MSYLVLARKWRPTTFDEVVGQGHVTKTLKNAIELDRVAHALLFTGSRGIGKTSCARILAKALNCVQGPTTQPCGACNFCIDISQGASVDIFEIDGASNNSVEQIREIRESVKFVPASGRRKVYIIDEVHMLSTSAFNALLKTLEEPPEHVLFIFATTEPHKIPDTILSRCQRYDFKRIGENEIVDALSRIANAEKIEVESIALAHIAREAHGGMRDSLSLLDQVIAFSGTRITENDVRDVLGIAGRTVLKALLAAILDSNGQQALELIDSQHRRGLDLTKFTAELVRFVRDLLVIRVCPDPGLLVDIPADELASLKDWVGQISAPTLHRTLNTLMSGADEIARSSFPKLVLEMTVLGMCQQGATLPLAEVLTGLQRLEAKLSNTGIEPGSLNSVVTPMTESRDSSDNVDMVEPTVTRAPDAAISQETPAVAATPPPSIQQNQAVSESPRPVETFGADHGVNSEVPNSVGGGSDELQHPPWESGPDAVSQSEKPASNGLDTSSAPVMETESKEIGSVENQSEREVDTEGYKKRPNDGDYDDFSAGPPQPRPLGSQRKLAVKPRISAALPQADVEKFLVTAAHSQPAKHSKAADRATQTAAVQQTVESNTSSPSDGEQAPVAEDSDDGVPIDLSDGKSPVEYLDALLAKVRQKDVFAASEMVQIIHPVEIGERRVLVAMAADHPEGLIDHCREHLQRAISGISNGVTSLEIVCCEPGDSRLAIETVYERRRRLEQELRAHRKECVRNDETVMRVAEMLDGELIDVKLRSVEEASSG